MFEIVKTPFLRRYFYSNLDGAGVFAIPIRDGHIATVVLSDIG
jgi:hypothetical protein